MLSEFLKKPISSKKMTYLISTRYALYLYLLIASKKETYMAEIEKSFIKYGSRSTLLKRILELEEIDLIESMESTDRRIKLLKIKEN